MNINIALIKEFGVRVDVENFRLRFNAIFWNSIWYFQILNLPFELFLSYEECKLSKTRDRMVSNQFNSRVSEFNVMNVCQNLVCEDNNVGSSCDITIFERLNAKASNSEYNSNSTEIDMKNIY